MPDKFAPSPATGCSFGQFPQAQHRPRRAAKPLKSVETLSFVAGAGAPSGATKTRGCVTHHPLRCNLAAARNASSQEALRVDIDLELEVACALGCEREPSPQISGEIEAARRFDQQAKAIPAAQHCKRRFRRSKNAHLRGGGRN